MILQPTSFKFYGSWILSSLVTTGLQKRGTSSIPRNLGTSKRRQQLNNCVSELLQLGDTPVPLRSHNLPKWFANYRLLLAPSCGQDITPIFSNQIRDLLKQLADLIGKRRVFTPKAIDDIMHVALGPAPTPGHVDCLSTCFPLACTVGSYSARFRRHDKFVSWDFIKCQLLANALPKQCESMLAESRSVLLIKIMDVISFVSQGAYNAIARLHDWFIMDLECFLGMTSSSEEKAAFIGDFLEVLACFQVPLCEPTEAYLYRFFTFAFLSLDQVHSRTWKSTNPMAGWRGIAIAMTINELERVLFKPETAFHVQQYLKATLETGFQFGNQIAPYIPDGVIPPAPKDLPEPGSFIVENGLLGLLTQFEWLNPDGCLEISRPAFVACMPDSLESLVKQATKEYKKATRLVNKTLKLVTELAVEEGIQLPEEENSRLLDDIADSDRRGVMSRAWESSPIKGSVPPMIVQLTSQPPLPNVLKVPKESPIVDFVRGTVTTNPNQVETYALLLLAGEALLSLFRDDSFKDIIDCETAVARMERGLSQLTERLPKGSSVLIEQLALDAMRTVRLPPTHLTKETWKDMYEVVAPHFGLKASLPIKNGPTPLCSPTFVPPVTTRPVGSRSVRRTVKKHRYPGNPAINSSANQCAQSESSSAEWPLPTDSPPLHSHTSSITPSLGCPPPCRIRPRTGFEFAFERRPLNVGMLFVGEIRVDRVL